MTVIKMKERLMDAAPFLTEALAHEIAGMAGTPCYVYDQAAIEAQAREVLAFPNCYGFTPRYAMKALPNSAIVRLLHGMGIHIDASSGYEVHRVLRAGVPADAIMLTSQELPKDFAELAEQGVRFNACSLHQLNAFGEAFPGAEVSVRINPGLGSGHSNRTNTGGLGSSFGIWHEHLGEVKAIAQRHALRITMMHTHIGSGSDPEVWHNCASLALAIAARLPEVTRLSLGGGFKVGRMPGEASADLHAIGQRVMQDIEAFAREHGRELHLELEPGSYYVVPAGAILSRVMDMTDTGPEGYRFLKLDCGMTEILRPSLYGAQHPMRIVPHDDTARQAGIGYMVVGHCCESGDILTPSPGDPEALGPRTLTEARIGDFVVIGGAGAYCAAMSAKNYNTFPEAPEVLIGLEGAPRLIRKRQTLDQVLQNELEGEGVKQEAAQAV